MKVQDTMEPMKMSKKRKAKTDLEISSEKKKDKMDEIMPAEKKKKKKKRVVLIGLKHPDPHMNTVDVKEQILRMKGLLISRRGFSDDDITLMIQDEQDKDHENQPTELNIRKKLIAVFEQADPGDILFVHLIAYGCSDGAIITSDEDHVPDSYFRALLWNARRLHCDVTFVSDCLIAPRECNCRIRPHISPTQKEIQSFLDDLIPENYHNYHRIDFGMWVPTKLSSVNINENDKKTTQHDDDDDSSRIVLLTRFQRDLNATTTQEEVEEEEVDPFDQNAATDQEVEDEEDSFDQNTATNQEKEKEEVEVEEEEDPFDQNANNLEKVEEEEEVEEEEVPVDQNATNQEKVEEEEEVEEEEDPFDQNATNQDKVEEDSFDQNAATNQEEEEEEEEEEEGDDREFEPGVFSCLYKKEKEHYLKTGSILIMDSDSEEEDQLDESYVSELFFPPPKGTITSPDHTSYGAFTKALLGVIEETDGWVTNLDLAKS